MSLASATQLLDHSCSILPSSLPNPESGRGVTFKQALSYEIAKPAKDTVNGSSFDALI